MSGAAFTLAPADGEAQAQSEFLASLWRTSAPQQLPAGLAPLPGHRAQAHTLSGLRAYRANGLAVAHRALMAAYPTVSAMVGDEAMKVLARDLWWSAPPLRGDLGLWGGALADWIEGFEPLAEYPWLPDCARLDWAVHEAATEADPTPGVEGLALLAEADPERLRLHLAPSLRHLHSQWPLAALRLEHQKPEPDLQAVGPLLSAATTLPTATVVWRQGWHTHVASLSLAELGFMQSLTAGHTLSQALSQTQTTDFDFQDWLLRALREAWVSRIQTV